MSSYETIEYTLDDGVAKIVLNRPDRRNAVNLQMLQELSAALAQATAEKARALVLTGSGRVFCSGGDLGGAGTKDGHDADLLWEEFMAALGAMPIPFVTAVNGGAVGVGCTLALAADFLVMAPQAYLQYAFANIGLFPSQGASWFLNRKVGHQRAVEMMMLAEKLGPERALEWGLAYKIAASEDGVLAEAEDLAGRLARGPTLAFTELKKVLGVVGDGGSLAETFKAERAGRRITVPSADFAEGIAAFREKRPPSFTGS